MVNTSSIKTLMQITPVYVEFKTPACTMTLIYNFVLILHSACCQYCGPSWVIIKQESRSFASLQRNKTLFINMQVSLICKFLDVFPSRPTLFFFDKYLHILFKSKNILFYKLQYTFIRVKL